VRTRRARPTQRRRPLRPVSQNSAAYGLQRRGRRSSRRAE